MRNTTRVITVKPKVWYASKTIWINVIGVLVAILSATEFQSLIPKTWLPYVVLVIFILNLVLRTFFTDAPLARSK